MQGTGRLAGACEASPYMQEVLSAAGGCTRLELLSPGVYVGVAVDGECCYGEASGWHTFPAGTVLQFTVQHGRWLGAWGSTTGLTAYRKEAPFPTHQVGEELAVHIPTADLGFIDRVLCRFPRPCRWGAVAAEAGLWQPHPNCDVFAMQEHDMGRLGRIRGALDALACRTGERVIPKYQHVIDPNLCVRQGRWVASEWDVSEEGMARIVGRGGGGAEHAHVHSQLVDEVFTPLLQAALPVLGLHLQRPALHLAGRRLQAVPKAQRILVPPRGVRVEGEASGEGGQYEGIWHSDGDVEDIVAVVLYYYNVDAGLEGGAMEFASRDVHAVLGSGDCSNNCDQFTQPYLRDEKGNDLPVFSVPVSTGTMLVFSNYQVVHRVLRILNKRDTEASRDFAALFIVDPDSPLPSAAEHLPSAERRAETDAEREQARLTKLRAQLCPRGSFGSGDSVCATGNGCFTMMSWLDKHLDERCAPPFDGPEGLRAYERMARTPQQVNRGASEMLSREDTGGGTDDTDE